MKILSKYGVVLVGVLWVLAGASVAFAFSIGELQVHSKFGGKFKASLEINLDVSWSRRALLLYPKPDQSLSIVLFFFLAIDSGVGYFSIKKR